MLSSEKGFQSKCKMYKGYLMVPVVSCLLTLFAAGCGDKDGRHRDTGVRVSDTEDGETPHDLKAKTPAPLPDNVKAVVEPYTVKDDLSNVTNLDVFKNDLTPEIKKKLVENGFAAVPTDYLQMYYIYENNEYKRPRYPAFITTDSMLHTYHVFFSYALRNLETDHLYEAAAELAHIMAVEAKRQLDATSSEIVKEAALINLAFFETARALLSEKKIKHDRRVENIVKKELELIEKHQGRSESPAMDVKIDYSMFKPRGHYTRTEELTRYFKAMVWFGTVPFELPPPDKGMSRAVVQALLITLAFQKAGEDKNSPAALWSKIYEPTKFFVGEADDFTFVDYAKVMENVYGKAPAPDDFASPDKMREFISKAMKLPGPRVEQFFYDGGTPMGRQFRFMGQRFIPDSRILQELTHPKVSQRYFPSGLDVFAALGSDRAFAHLDKHYSALEHPNYKEQLVKMRNEMAGVDNETWQSNLYWGWLWMLDALIEKTREGFPSFMQNHAWEDKSLFTALGSWTELRHDTVLYAKPSAAQCGGDEEEEKLRPRGYVEPNLVFWDRLKRLTDITQKGLAQHGILGEELKSRLDWVSEWTEFCRRITIKQLTEERVTDDEYQKMRYFGPEMEILFQQMSGGQIMTEDDKDMAVVVDVHTSTGQVLEQGVGRAAAVYVIVPTGGKLRLTRGGMFTHYEFTQPASDRLNNQQWRKMLKDGKAPPLAPWIRTFFIEGQKRKKDGVNRHLGGC